MFLLLSADPTLARNSVWRKPNVSFWDKTKTPMLLPEILSWAADGFLAGKEYWERGRFPRCPYGGLYDIDGKENMYYGLDPLRKAWHAWLEGFEQGLKENTRKPRVGRSRYGNYKVIEYA